MFEALPAELRLKMNYSDGKILEKSFKLKKLSSLSGWTNSIGIGVSPITGSGPFGYVDYEQFYSAYPSIGRDLDAVSVGLLPRINRYFIGAVGWRQAL